MIIIYCLLNERKCEVKRRNNKKIDTFYGFSFFTSSQTINIERHTSVMSIQIGKVEEKKIVALGEKKERCCVCSVV